MQADPTPRTTGAWAHRIKAVSQLPLVRWLAAGLGFMGLNSLLLYLFIGQLGLRVAIGSLVAAEVCTLLRFFVNQYWVFRSRDAGWRRLWQYHLANGTAFVVWWCATNVLEHFGVHYLLAGILAVGFSTGFSMASNFLWIWRKKTKPPA